MCVLCLGGEGATPSRTWVGGRPTLLISFLPLTRAISSVGERCIHTAEVTGSNPVSPTSVVITTTIYLRIACCRCLVAYPIAGACVGFIGTENASLRPSRGRPDLGICVCGTLVFVGSDTMRVACVCRCECDDRPASPCCSLSGCDACYRSLQGGGSTRNLRN